MKAAFSAPSRVEVVLSRPGVDGQEGEKIKLLLSPSPIGFREYLEACLPRPVIFVNGRPEGVDPKKGPGWSLDIQLVLLGKSLGDQVEAPFPATLDEAGLRAYVQSLRAEFERANLTTGDINQLLLGLERANAGLGKKIGGNRAGNGAGVGSAETAQSAASGGSP